MNSLPIDTGRKLNAHKTFRRRPGRLLNVLCTFMSRLTMDGMLQIHCLFWTCHFMQAFSYLIDKFFACIIYF